MLFCSCVERSVFGTILHCNNTLYRGDLAHLLECPLYYQRVYFLDYNDDASMENIERKCNIDIENFTAYVRGIIDIFGSCAYLITFILWL